MKFGIDVKGLIDVLPIMGKGMLGIFIVIGVIILLTMVLNKATANIGKKDK